MSLIVWLPLNGDLHNQGCSNWTFTNTNVTVDSAGKIGSCYNFLSGSYLKATDVSLPITSWSAACWCYPTTSSASGHQYMVGMNTSTASDFTFVLTHNTDLWGVRTGGTTYLTEEAVTQNTWTHIAATYDGSTLNIYINGVLKKTQANPATPVAATTCWIGRRGATGGNFVGKLNDIRIYDHCLSAAEVKEISQGLVQHYKLDDLTNGVLDSSGYGHNGSTLNTVSISSDTPRYSASVNLPETNSMINCGRGGMVTDSITISFWCKYNTITTSIISSFQSYGVGFNENNGSISFSLYVTDIGWCRSQEGENAQQISGSTLTEEWHMWTGVYDRINQKLQLYIDGDIKQENAISSPNVIRYNANNVLWIGGEATSSDTTGNNGTAGLFSDFRIYCTALSADDILSLYHTSAKVDNKQNFHTFELVENNSAIKINKRGQTLCNELEENTATKFYKTNQIIETNEIIEL